MSKCVRQFVRACMCVCVRACLHVHAHDSVHKNYRNVNSVRLQSNELKKLFSIQTTSELEP